MWPRGSKEQRFFEFSGSNVLDLRRFFIQFREIREGVRVAVFSRVRIISLWKFLLIPARGGEERAAGCDFNGAHSKGLREIHTGDSSLFRALIRADSTPLVGYRVITTESIDYKFRYTKMSKTSVKLDYKQRPTMKIWFFIKNFKKIIIIGNSVDVNNSCSNKRFFFNSYTGFSIICLSV